MRDYHHLPGWPPLMREDLAAAYLAMSPAMLREKVEKHEIAPPRRLSEGRIAYVKALLDVYVARVADLAPDPVQSLAADVAAWDEALGGDRDPTVS